MITKVINTKLWDAERSYQNTWSDILKKLTLYCHIPISDNRVWNAWWKWSCIRYDTHFHKVFKVYTQLWKFQQENRQKLMEAGLKRWEIGDIASRIGQLYFGQYMRTSQAKYLSEAYIFYEAVLTREYFKDGLSHDLNLASKQLRFLARFLTVCLVFNRREMIHQLVNHLKMLVAECKRTFPVINLPSIAEWGTLFW